HQQPVRPGEALELDAERAAHRAARAVCADQVAAGARLGFPAALDRYFDAGRRLADGLDRTVELQIEIRMSPHLLIENAGELRLLALHAVGVLRGVGDG